IHGSPRLPGKSFVRRAERPAVESAAAAPSNAARYPSACWTTDIKHRRTMRLLFLLMLIVCLLAPAQAQTPAAPPVWQVTSFDVNATVQQTERTINVVATISATNVG